MVLKKPSGRFPGNLIWIFIVIFASIMSLLSLYLDSQPFFETSLTLQRIFIGVFGSGEILLISIGVTLGLKKKTIVLRRKDNR